MSRRTRIVAAAVVALLFAGCDTTRPTPSPEPSVLPAPPTDFAESPAAPTPTASPAAPQSAAERIIQAVDEGRIDEATGYLYRFYARVGDNRLPEAFRGPWSEDDALAPLAADALDRLTDAERSTLRPFLARPTADGSYWSTQPQLSAAPGTTGSVRLAAFVAAVTCIDGWSRTDVASIPVTIWGRCRLDASGQPAVPLTAATGQVSTFMTDLWGPMTRLMGPPIPDQFAGSSRAPNEPVEAGDGRLDIYIVEAPDVSYLRNVANDDLAVTYTTAPYDDGTSSAYMVVDPTKASSAAVFKSNVAHEFFHVLSDRYNATRKFFCPYPNVAAACGTGRESHWFSEASATWAEHHFVPPARPTEIYEARFKPFLAEAVGLSAGGLNRYESFLWLLFMEQESARGEGAIADAWKATKGKTTWRAIQQAVDAQMPFTTRFRDFAVRVWNEDLEPGDPIRPRFQALDPNFPTIAPHQGSPAPRFREPEVRLDPFVVPSMTLDEDLPDLWAAYREVSIDSFAKRLTLDFTALQPNGNLDVNALVKIRDVGWELRALSSGKTEFCLERSADAIERMILILSNHSQTPNDHVRGTWQAEAGTEGCLTVSDSVTYTLTYETGQPGDDYYAVTTESLSLNVNLKSSAGGFAFDDAGSTYQASVTQRSVVRDPFNTGCDTVSEGHAQRGGTFPPAGSLSADGITAGLVQEFEPPAGQTARPNGWWLLSLAASVALPLETTTTSCIGTGTAISEYVVQLQPCDGIEVGAGGATRTFSFNCSFNQPGYRWSVVGRIRVAG